MPPPLQCTLDIALCFKYAARSTTTTDARCYLHCLVLFLLYAQCSSTFYSDVKSLALLIHACTSDLLDKYKQGGAVSIKFAAPHFSSCAFANNTAATAGGAVFLFFARPVPTQLQHTTAGYTHRISSSGSSIAAAADSSTTVSTFSACQFTGNSAGGSAVGANPGGGGAVAAMASSPQFTECVFSSNSALAPATAASVMRKSSGTAPTAGATTTAATAATTSAADVSPKRGTAASTAGATATASGDVTGVRHSATRSFSSTASAVAAADGVGMAMGGALFFTSDCAAVVDSCSFSSNTIARSAAGTDVATVAGEHDQQLRTVRKLLEQMHAVSAAAGDCDSSCDDAPTLLLSECSFKPADSSQQSFLYMKDGGVVRLTQPNMDSVGDVTVIDSPVAAPTARTTGSSADVQQQYATAQLQIDTGDSPQSDAPLSLHIDGGAVFITADTTTTAAAAAAAVAQLSSVSVHNSGLLDIGAGVAVRGAAEFSTGATVRSSSSSSSDSGASAVLRVKGDAAIGQASADGHTDEVRPAIAVPC
jgi:trimeric autotransporter adhesin